MAVFSTTKYTATEVRIDGQVIVGQTDLTVIVYTSHTEVVVDALDGVFFGILTPEQRGDVVTACMHNGSDSVISWKINTPAPRPVIWLNR